MGIDTCLKLGADFIVNTDGDNQYFGQDIPALVAPLIRGEADIVIGDRNLQEIEHLSRGRKFLQRLGSWVVRQVSNTRVPDTTSGFRAYTREAALRMTIVSEFTYTLESIIQAGKKRMAIGHVRCAHRRTRLTVIPQCLVLEQSGSTIVRIYRCEPLKVFTSIGALAVAAGLATSARFLLLFHRQRRWTYSPSCCRPSC